LVKVDGENKYLPHYFTALRATRSSNLLVNFSTSAPTDSILFFASARITSNDPEGSFEIWGATA
jgi:hypothetical protein